MMSISKLFDGLNAGYAQDLYERYARNPDSVPPEWREIFSGRIEELVADGLITPDALRGNGSAFAPATRVPVRVAAATPPAAPAAVAPVAPTIPVPASPPPATGSASDGGAELRALLPRVGRAVSLIHAFRDHGHQLARLDPLGSEPPGHPRLDPAFFGTSMEDLARIPASVVLEEGGDEPLSEALQRLREIYCGSIGFQFEHLEDPTKVKWLWAEAESGRHALPLEREEQVELLRRLSEVEGLERFLHRSYLGQKRFSLEGTDILVPMLDLAIERAAAAGAQRVVLGMAHRGRLNVLTHILGLSSQDLLREFEDSAGGEGTPLPHSAGTGDVKYHRGAEGEYPLRDGSRIRVTLAPNPSHLEFVNPVVMGMARALQHLGPEAEAARDPAAVVPILLHGDAAFAAEGVVAESLNLARLRGYTVGGTVHLIVNNQVGFTTTPEDGRSTRYASDLAKGYDIPVLHVNADDPEACLTAIRLAMAYREKFQDDVVIDLIGYRRHGHNEGDEPTYTQPLLYARIAEHPTVRTQWSARLAEEGILSGSESEAIEAEVAARLRSAQAEVQGNGAGKSAGGARPPDPAEAVPPDTSLPYEVLEEIHLAAHKVPDGFVLHPKLARQLDRRRSAFDSEVEVDWGQAEALALGGLLRAGIPVRISGQDTERGTFSHRHLVLHDAESGRQITPLASIGGARLEVYNSPLSEAAALGFEYGISVADPDAFVAWEAQFGDFVNVAQAILDQFIAAGEAKWRQSSRLTLLLPHGYEGQGPEHSSARLERFLQLCAEENLRVAYPTTPAQYFHLLRRQALASPRRPLVVMTPKSLLRHPRAVSPVSELSRGGFRAILPDPTAPGAPEEVRRLVLCSGKLYYDLVTAEGRDELRSVAVGRIEGLYPFPSVGVAALVQHHPKVEEVVWAQEEPRNMGALAYIGPRLRSALPKEVALSHVSRPERASPAEGKHRAHKIQQDRIVREALGLD